MIGGAEGDRTPDLRIANATLSQLSYGPIAQFELFAGRPNYGERVAPCQAATLPKRDLAKTACWSAALLADPGC
jgi:hypothetical protein